jgi:hypothetical protein
VPEVTSTETPRAQTCSTMGITASISPMLAACSQTSGPSGRGMSAWPRRSRTRAGNSLPRRRRLDASNGANGIAAAASRR